MPLDATGITPILPSSLPFTLGIADEPGGVFIRLIRVALSLFEVNAR